MLDSSLATGDTLQELNDVLHSRIVEGHGETLFDLGQEDNGESMRFSREQWDVALDRLRRAATALKADCRILMTRNVGGEVEVGPINEKDKSATSKIMIRRKPVTAEDVIETRIAVVGNGKLENVIITFNNSKPRSRRRQKHDVGCPGEGQSR